MDNRWSVPTLFLILTLSLCPIGAAAEITIKTRYLHFPVGAGGREPVNVQLRDGGKLVHYFRVALPAAKNDLLYWASVDVHSFAGRKLSVEIQPPLSDTTVAGLIEQSDVSRRPDSLYAEPLRPQFHFTAPTGWINDPNGLVYLDGEYHLFYQHNPYGTAGGNKSWGHGVSRDLVHWTDLGDVLLPDGLGAIYSGSAVVDHQNTSGFQSGSIPPLVAFYTSAGVHAPERLPYTQSMAFSNDRGRTWMKYEHNPVIQQIEENNRDPKVFWYGPASRWIMVLYLSRGKFALMGSRNLRDWSSLSEVDFPDGHECPDLFEMPVNGNRRNTRWVIWEGSGRHMIGRFDGQKFTPETGVLPSEWGSSSYAGQTWNEAPDGRRLFISWMRTAGSKLPGAIYPNMPFNQQMIFPRELALRTTSEGTRLFAQPVREISKLYAKQQRFTNLKLAPGRNPLSGISSELVDIEADLEIGDAKSLILDIRGTPVVYDARTGELTCLGRSVRIAAGKALNLRALVDRTSIELFASGDRFVMSFCFRPESANREFACTSEGGTAMVRSLAVRILNPALPIDGRR